MQHQQCVNCQWLPGVAVAEASEVLTIKNTPTGLILRNRGEESLAATSKLLWKVGLGRPLEGSLDFFIYLNKLKQNSISEQFMTLFKIKNCNYWDSSIKNNCGETGSCSTSTVEI